MTRKDYEVIAKAINQAHRANEAYHCDITKAEVGREAIERTAKALAEVLRRDNPRFDTARFLIATTK